MTTKVVEYDIRRNLKALKDYKFSNYGNFDTVAI